MRYINKFLGMFVLTLVISSVALVFSADVMALIPICDVQISKEAVPVDGTEFPFTITGDITDEFTIQSDECEQFDLPTGDTIMVTEQTPDGWGLRDIDCRTINASASIAGQTVTITCDDIDGQAFCNFVNISTEAVPTISQWGIMALVVVLGVIGFMVMRRKKVTA